MNIQQELLKEHSKAQTTRISRFIGNNEHYFKELMTLFLGDEYRTAQRAAWVVNYCSIAHQQLLKPYLKRMVLNIDKKGIHDSVKRNTVRMLQFAEIPGSLKGKTIDACFRLLISSEEPVAIKVFSMTVLSNLCKQYPDLKGELIAVIEKQLPYSSAAFISRAKRTMKELEGI